MKQRWKSHRWVIGVLAVLVVGCDALLWLHPSLGFAHGGILNGADPRGSIIHTPWKPALVGALVDLGVDADSGEHVLRGDFSALQTPGHYRVVLPRRGYSAPFRIHSEVYREVLRLATRFFRLPFPR